MKNQNIRRAIVVFVIVAVSVLLASGCSSTNGLDHQLTWVPDTDKVTTTPLADAVILKCTSNTDKGCEGFQKAD